MPGSLRKPSTGRLFVASTAYVRKNDVPCQKIMLGLTAGLSATRAYAHAQGASGWGSSARADESAHPVSGLPLRERFVHHELGIIARLHRAGVPLLAGTDTPAGIGIVPGFSLHPELQRFTDAGFTSLEALQTATINPAKFLDRLADFGTVEKGKLADLVLLDANPLDDIRNTRKITAVIANGRYYPREQLYRILADIEVYATTH